MNSVVEEGPGWPPSLTLDQERMLKLMTGDRFYTDASAALREAVLNAIDAVHRRREENSEEFSVHGNRGNTVPLPTSSGVAFTVEPTSVSSDGKSIKWKTMCGVPTKSPSGA